MKRPLLVVADSGDRLADAVMQLVPDALRHDGALPFARWSLELDAAGMACAGRVDDGARSIDLRECGGVLFRPGRGWRRRHAFVSVDEALADHELRATWAAWLSIWPGPVCNRLPPAWFQAPSVYRLWLARELAAAAGVKAGAAAAATAVASSHCVGDTLLAAGSADGRGAAALTLPALRRWRAATGLDFARIDIGADGSIVAVEPVPSLAGQGGAGVARIARHIVAGLV